MTAASLQASVRRPAPAPPPADAPATRPGSGACQAAVLIATAGLCLIAGAFALERLGQAGTLHRLVFWVGLAAIVVPVTLPLLSERTRRGDRIVLVAVFGLLLYAVKVLRDPVVFTISDEFTHATATQRLIDTGALFATLPLGGENVASGYPGLHAVTGAVSEITGLSVFASGLAVVGAARIVLMVGLFLLLERFSDSARIAGLGTMLYAGSANFLLWDSQFSYQSLSLPLFVVALLAVLERQRSGPRRRRALTTCLLALVVAIVATHHVTSYMLAGCLSVMVLMAGRSGRRVADAALLAGFAIGAAAAWFLLVATDTGSYLGFVARRTYEAVSDAANRGTRVPFQTSGIETPLGERALAFVAVAIVFAGVVWGLSELRSRRRIRGAPSLLLALLGLAFVAQYPLKLFPGAWETANRASDFLFIGVALLLALAVTAVASRGRRARTLLVCAVAVAICGGVSQGWPASLLLSQPVEIEARGAVLAPEGLAVARWATADLPAGASYVADEASGRALAVNGAAAVLAGRAAGTPQLFSASTLEPWERQRLIEERADFVVVDRRRITAETLPAYFFQRADRPDGGYGYFPRAVRSKFEAIPRSSRVLDSGEIVVYDVRGLRAAPARCRDVNSRWAAQVVPCRTPSAYLSFATADRVLWLPGLKVRLLSTRVDQSVEGLVVNAVIQAENMGTREAALDPDWRHLWLRAGSSRIERTRRDPYRRDNLEAGTPLAAGEKRQGSLRFVLRGRAAARFRRAGGELRIRLAGTSKPPRVGVIRLRGRSESVSP
jgi:hypothetical protein